MKKIMIVLLIAALLFLVTGCKESRDIPDGFSTHKSIKAIVNDFQGGVQEYEINKYSIGSTCVILYTTDNREICTSVVNVILIEELP